MQIYYLNTSEPVLKKRVVFVRVYPISQLPDIEEIITALEDLKSK